MSLGDLKKQHSKPAVCWRHCIYSVLKPEDTLCLALRKNWAVRLTSPSAQHQHHQRRHLCLFKDNKDNCIYFLLISVITWERFIVGKIKASPMFVEARMTWPQFVLLAMFIKHNIVVSWFEQIALYFGSRWSTVMYVLHISPADKPPVFHWCYLTWGSAVLLGGHWWWPCAASGQQQKPPLDWGNLLGPQTPSTPPAAAPAQWRRGDYEKGWEQWGYKEV